jgi:glucose dehydrogenase
MRFWVRENGTPPFHGPFDLGDIAVGVREGRISPTCELLEASGQSYGALKRATDWRPLSEFDPPPTRGPTGMAAATAIDRLVFVGLNGYVVALDRDTGQIVWSNNELKSGYVTLLLDGDRLVVSTNGYLFCLDPLTGRVLWNNRMSGYGRGAPTSLISVRGQSSQTVIQQAAEATGAEQAASEHGHRSIVGT